ncbi:VanW family protein [Rummeliibacillus sp. JY-2-4R]
MKKWIVTLILLCSIELMGCTDLANEQRAIKTTKETIKENENEVKAEVKPEVIQIIDPNTSEIIQTISPKELGFEENQEEYVGKLKELAKLLARGDGNNIGYDQRMKLDHIDENGQIIKGKPMIILKETELVDRILKTSKTGGRVELPLYETKSEYDVSKIPQFSEVTVAKYTTKFNRTDTNRNKNIEISANALNGVIVGVGDYFSFNTIVGPRNRENGYQQAPEIVNKKLVMGIGGGVCQTSSTLFNAIDQLPIKYIERNHHSLHVGYVPEGRDATVSFGTLDFRFQNTSGVPLLINTIYGVETLTVEIKTSKENALKLN